MQLYFNLLFPTLPLIALFHVFFVIILTISVDCTSDFPSEETKSFQTNRPLSIVFTENLPELYDKPFLWNGQIAREVRGISGAHTASMFLAEGLAALGHHVQYISDFVFTAEYKGVNYISASIVSSIECDVFITTYNFTEFSLLKRIPFKYKKILMLLNKDPVSAYTVSNELLALPREKLSFVHVSRFGKLNIMYTHQWLEHFDHKLFTNSIDIEEIPLPIDMSQKLNRFVFFPCLDYGSGIAFQVALHFPEFEFHAMTYSLQLNEETAPAFMQHFGEDKRNQLRFLTNTGKNAIYESKIFCLSNRFSFFSPYSL
jgi:hypothetical protein